MLGLSCQSPDFLLVFVVVEVVVFAPLEPFALRLQFKNFRVRLQLVPDLLLYHVTSSTRVAHDVDMQKHGNEGVFGWLVAVSILQVKLNVFVDVGTVEGCPLGIVLHDLVSHSVRCVAVGRIRSTSTSHLGFDGGFASIIE